MIQDPIRTYVLAKELNLPSELIVRAAHHLGFDISALGSVTPDQRAAIVAALRQSPPDEPPLGIHSKVLPRGPQPGSARHQAPPPNDQPD